MGRYGGGIAAPQSAMAIKGDTVYALARRHNVSVRALIEANGLRPPYHLYPGQTIYLPAMAEHMVVAGDTVSQIARAYGVAVSDLVRANNLDDPSLIRVGQRLRLPKAAAASGDVVIQTIARSPTTGPVAKPEPAQLVRPPSSAQTVAAPIPPRSARPPLPEPPRFSGGFVWPVKGEVIARFGPQGKGLHNDGINIAVLRGTPVHAAADGVVAYAGNELRGFGWLLLIKHDNGWMSAYAHNEELLVARGTKIKKGQMIARAGASGNVRTPQLHFELRKGTTPVDPLEHLPTLRAALE